MLRRVVVDASEKSGSNPGFLVAAATVHASGIVEAATAHSNGIVDAATAHNEGMEGIKEGMQFFAVSLFCSALVLAVSIYVSVATFIISTK
jgi:hypothetical protein